MNFKVVCSNRPNHPEHCHFWTSVPITQYWTCRNGKWLYDGTGKMWNPDKHDDYFCMECGEPADVIEGDSNVSTG